MLIPKKSDRCLLINYHLISLLAPTYKTMAKTLANHFKQHLNLWIMLSQTTFVQGRNIFDNVMMANKDIF